MKLFSQFVLMLAVSLASAGVAARTPWQHYLALPTPANARAVKSIEYDLPASSNDDGERLTFDLQLLTTQVNAGDIEALRLTLRLADTQDGAILEELGMIAGGVVRSHPAAFLQAESALSASARCFGVDSTDPSFTDRFQARQYEFNARKGGS